MSILSAQFLIFLGILLFLYYLIPKRFQWVLLLIASYIFYSFSGIRNFIFILLTTLTTYFSSIQMQRIEDRKETLYIEGRTKKENKAQVQKKKRKYLLFSVLANFGVLLILKYTGVFEPLINLFTQGQATLDLGFLIPLGISFYTFQSIGYVIDVYYARIQAEENVFKYALFISYFPQLTQGPISRFEDLQPQLLEGKSFHYTKIKYGIELFIWGAFKKLVIADRTAVLVNTIFDKPEARGMYLVIGICFYSIQIYTDFSGGIDMVRGVSQMLQINLVENFNQPFFAKSVSNFWQRWHISLGNWMRTYIFYPIAISPKVNKLSKKLETYIGRFLSKQFSIALGTTVVFICVGLWHGSGMSYVFYGLYMAFFSVLEPIMEPLYKRVKDQFHLNDKSLSYRVFQMVRTFILINFARFLTISTSLSQGLAMQASVLRDTGATFQRAMFDLVNFYFNLDSSEMMVLGLAVLVLFFVGLAHEKGVEIRPRLDQTNLVFRWLVLYALIFSVLIFGYYGPSIEPGQFIYRGY